MGTKGVPYKPIPKSVIISTIKSFKGRLHPAADKLGIHYVTLKKHIDADPELVKLLEDERQAYDCNLCDVAEDVLTYAMNQTKTDLTNALKSTFFVLNNKGLLRGYKPTAFRQLQEEITDGVIQAVQDINATSRDRASSESKLADKQSVLDKGCTGKACAVPTELGSTDTLSGLFPV